MCVCAPVCVCLGCRGAMGLYTSSRCKIMYVLSSAKNWRKKKEERRRKKKWEGVEGGGLTLQCVALDLQIKCNLSLSL